MTEDDYNNETFSQIEQIKLGCTVWVPRLLPEEIYEYTRREKPLKLNKIGDRHYEIDESSDNECEPITISLSDTESDDSPSTPLAAIENVAENISVNEVVSVECVSRKVNTENFDTNISLESPAMIETFFEARVTQANVQPVNFTVKEVPIDESQNAVVETVSETSTVIPALSIAAAAAVETQANVSPINFIVTKVPTSENPKTAVETVSEVSAVISESLLAPKAEDALTAIVTPSELMKKTDLIVRITRPVEKNTSAMTIADAVDVTMKSLLLSKYSSSESFDHRDDSSIPSLDDANLMAKDPISSTSRSSIALPSLPAKNAIPISSQLLPAASTSLSTQDGTFVSKIRVKSTQDLGVKDPESGTNFLNKIEISTDGVDNSLKQSVEKTNISRTISMDEFNKNIIMIAYSFQLQLGERKQYETKLRQLLRNLNSSASSATSSNDGEIKLQLLRNKHENSIRGMNEKIILVLEECFGYRQFDIILENVFKKFLELMRMKCKKLECIENLSQMWLNLINSQAYSASSLIKLISKERFLTLINEIFLYFDKQVAGRKRVLPTQPQPQMPLQQSSQDIPVKVPRLNDTTAIPSVSKAMLENRNSMWLPQSSASSSTSQISSSDRMAEIPVAINSMSKSIQRCMNEPSQKSSWLGVQNSLNDWLGQAYIPNTDLAFTNVISQMPNAVPAREEVANTANRSTSNIMNARPLHHFYEKSPAPFLETVITNDYTNRGRVIRQTVGDALIRPPGSGQLPSAIYPYISVSPNVAPFQHTTVHSSVRFPSPNHSSGSPRPPSPAYSSCSSHCNCGSCRPISSHSSSNYPSSISPSYSNSPYSIHPVSNYNPSYNATMPPQAYANRSVALQRQSLCWNPSPRPLPPNTSVFHQNLPRNDHQIRGRNFNEPSRNYVSNMNNSVIRQNVNFTVVSASSTEQQNISQLDYARGIMQRSTQHVSPIHCDNTYTAFPEIESSQNYPAGYSKQVDLPPFSSFITNENLVVQVADSTLSPSAGPSPNPTFNNEMPLSVPIVQSTSSLSVDQLYELEGLQSIDQPLKDSEMQELLSNLNVHLDKEDGAKNKSEF